MMGERRVDQSALFYAFSLERHVPADHMLRAIDRFVELDGLRAHLAPFYSAIGRPSIDPELLIRMLLVGYCFGIRSCVVQIKAWCYRSGSHAKGVIPIGSLARAKQHNRSQMIPFGIEWAMRRCGMTTPLFAPKRSTAEVGR